LQQVNIGGQLQQMMGQGTEFRGQQSSVIRAIIAGKTPVIQITSTGGGKSLSFMLPAYCSPDGTTIVIVPLLALQDDLLDRCRKLKITAHIWKSRQGNPVASVVFVTPESAVTGGFGDFVRRLQSRGVLDRVVVDECHTLLDGSAEFRPKLSEVGQTIRRWGIQRVFLTATLGPEEMERFYGIAAINPAQSIVFRSKTTRANIQYSVIQVKSTHEDQEVEENTKVCKIVQEWLEKNQEGKVIVYTGSVDRVKKVGEMLGCGTYYNGVDTAKGKKERLQTWIYGERVIVATNALGMGIDVANVRLVVHAWMPRRMRDYVQESGRAGRDSQVSQAVIVCGHMHKDSKAKKQQQQAQEGRKNKAKEREENTVDYVEKNQCRRITLDRSMDGRTDREECEDDEEQCDNCSRYYCKDNAEEAQDSAENRVYSEAQAIFQRQKKETDFQE
jgi:RecQ family ATP-dependent DNA helicase